MHRLPLLALVLLSMPLPRLFAASSPFDEAESGPKPLKVISVKASSERPDYPAANVADGDATEASRWISLGFRELISVELTLPSKQMLTGLHVFSGTKGQNALRDFVVQFWRDDTWVNVPSAPWRDVTTEMQPVSDRMAVFFTFATEAPDLTACELLSFRFKQN